jgi:hypothetical protein
MPASRLARSAPHGGVVAGEPGQSQFAACVQGSAGCFLREDAAGLKFAFGEVGQVDGVDLGAHADQAVAISCREQLRQPGAAATPRDADIAVWRHNTAFERSGHRMRECAADERGAERPT